MSATTLLLSDDWDICLDSSGNIAVAIDAYAIAQNVANAVRLFTDDAYYFPQDGIPHFGIELGKNAKELVLLRSRLIRAALAVEGVAAATITNLGVNRETRAVTGTITLTTMQGETADVAL